MLKFDGRPADPCAATDAEDAAVEGPLDSEVAVYQSDTEDIGDDCDALLASFEGPWIVNLASGSAHKGVKSRTSRAPGGSLVDPGWIWLGTMKFIIQTLSCAASVCAVTVVVLARCCALRDQASCAHAD